MVDAVQSGPAVAAWLPATIDAVVTRVGVRKPPPSASTLSADAMAELPESCQQILDRFFARDESYRTIGDTLGLPAGTIASRISRCLDKLRDAFEGEGRNASHVPSGRQVT